MEDIVSPQPYAVGEDNQFQTEKQSPQDANQSYASKLVRQPHVAAKSNLEFCPVTVENGIPTIEFTVEEVNTFTKEEGLQQAVVIKFSYGKPELQLLRQILPKQLEVKGNCNIGQLEYRHILVRFDLFEDFANVVSKTTGYVKAKGDDFFFRTFPWTMGFNPREETSKAVVWISFPELPAIFFAKKSLMSIASAVGKPISVDKATKDRTRSSTTRVKVLIDLLDKLPQKVKIKIVDIKAGKIIEYDQRIVFDNLPKYCTTCNHQGHDDRSCRWNTNEVKEQAVHYRHSEDRGNLGKLKGDAREFLNANRVARNNERVLPNLNTGAANPAARIGKQSTVLNVSNKQVISNVSADPKNEVHSNLITKKATNDRSNLKASADHMMQLLTNCAGTSYEISDKPSSVNADPGTEKQSNVKSDTATNVVQMQTVESNFTDLISEQQVHSAKGIAEVFELPSNLNSVSVLSKVQVHREQMASKQAFATDEDFNQKANEQPNENVLLDGKVDQMQIVGSKCKELISEQHIANETVEVIELQPQLNTATDQLKLDVHCEHMASKLTFVTDEENSIEQPNKTEMIPEQHIAKDKVDLIELHSQVNTGTIQSKLDDHSDHMAYKLSVANAEEFNQNVIEQPKENFSLNSNADQRQTVESNSSEMIPEQHHTKDKGELIELLSQGNTDTVQLKIDTHIDHKASKLPLADDKEINQNEIELPKEKFPMNNNDDQRQTVEISEQHLAKPAEDFNQKAIEQSNKTRKSQNKTMLPSISNSFDVFNNVNDEESQNSEAKRKPNDNYTIVQSLTAPSVPKRTKSNKSKTWKDQGDYDDEETWGEGLASFSWEEEDLDFEENSDDSVTQKIQRKNPRKNSRENVKQTTNSNRKLNHNAPVYVPRNNTKTDRSIEGTSKKSINAAAETVAISTIPSEERQVLETMVNTETVMNNAQLTTQGECPDLPSLSNAGNHLYEEGEEEDYINQCRADVYIKGDVSPKHNAKMKKAHQREGNMGEVRKPPMRNAKQKQAAQANFPKSNRLKNKS